MNTYEKAKAMRRQKQGQVNAQVRGAMQGLTPRTAKITFDMSNRSTNTINENKNARIKAVAMVSDLLESFELPSRAKFEYLGMVKEATSKDGTIEDGVVKIGAVIPSLMGHKISIDIPVIIKKKSLLEPAVFFYDGAPYILCRPALDQLVKRGTLNKEVLERRNMYAPPPMEQWMAIDHETARTPIINRDHMFNPGSRNPWKFKRYSQTTPQRQQVDLLNPEEVREPTSNELSIDQMFAELSKLELQDTDKQMVPSMKKYYDSGRWKTDEDGREFITSNLSQALQRNREYLDIGKNVSEGAGIEPGEVDWRSPATKYKTVDAAKEKTPRERTNIDTPTEMPELWKGDVAEEVLDMAERDRSDIWQVGDEVKLSKDFEVRERGGSQLVIPSGEKGKIIRNVDGAGMCFMVEFPEMELTVPEVPSRFLKRASTHPFDREAQFPTQPGAFGITNDGKPLNTKEEYDRAVSVGTQALGRVDNLVQTSRANAASRIATHEQIEYAAQQCMQEAKTPGMLEDIASKLTTMGNEMRQLAMSVQQPAGGVKQAVRRASTIDQVKHEVREMLREGYPAVDIKAAVEKKYPEHASEALKGL
jgi:hypothetical protein